jgi:heavy-metal-associated domain-containing protein
MRSELATDHHRAWVASHVPGRMRVKLGPASRAPHVLDGIRSHLKSHAGIHQVTVDPPSGSVTVHYDPQRHEEPGLLAIFEDCYCVFQTLESAPESSSSAPSAGFVTAVEDLSAKLSAATGVRVDLKLVLPLSLLGAGIWSIARRGLMLESVPGLVFVWLALDSFVKLHPAPARELT